MPWPSTDIDMRYHPAQSDTRLARRWCEAPRRPEDLLFGAFGSSVALPQIFQQAMRMSDGPRRIDVFG